MIEKLATWLDGQTALLTAGTNLYAHTLAPSTGRCIALQTRPTGATVVRSYQVTMPIMENATLRVLARTTSPAGGADTPYSTGTLALLRVVQAKFETVANQVISGTTFYAVMATGSHWQENRDSQGRIVYAQDFTVSYRPSTSY